MDYTKFKLKPKEAILDLTRGREGLFIINCAKCYTEFNETEDSSCRDLSAYIRESGKNISGCLHIDFLCNKTLTEKVLKEKLKSGGEITVLVNSCGVGVQTVAEILPGEVYTVADSVNQGGYHGMALSQEKCYACAECVLTHTGGICPVVECSKSLLNGSCGGAKNGKCEISPEKDCGWEKIDKAMKKYTNKVQDIEKIQLHNHKILP